MLRSAVPVNRFGPGPRGEAGAGPDEDEGFLLASAAGGDLTAFRALVDRHLGGTRRLARHILGRDSDAEDVAQDAMLRLWQSAGSLELEARGLRPWLARVTANLCIDRKRSARRLVLVETLPETAEPAGQDAALAARETSQRVARALQILPERQRLALTLFHYEEFTVAAIAAVMELSDEAVESLLARGRRSLRAELRDEIRQLLEDNT
jgi:RNA polymerase sigma-70 factor (ECF subfamily)